MTWEQRARLVLFSIVCLVLALWLLRCWMRLPPAEIRDDPQDRRS